MIIVAGWLLVDPDELARYLADATTAVEAAQLAPGCIEFHLGADPTDAGRIIVFEQWESAAHVEAFRGDGTPAEQAAQILDAAVYQHEIASTIQL